MGRPTSLLLFGALVIVATLYSLSELHKSSTDQKDVDDTRHRFATEFQMVGSAISRAWRSNLGGGEDSDSRTSVVADDTPPSERLGQCFVYKRADLWGDALNNGATNKLTSAAECCNQCSMAKNVGEGQAPCNVWVFCGDRQWCGTQYGQCWWVSRGGWGGDQAIDQLRVGLLTCTPPHPTLAHHIISINKPSPVTPILP